MNKQVMMLAGGLWLVGCGGSGRPWSGGGSDAGPDGIGAGPAGPLQVGGSYPVGGGVAVSGAGGTTILDPIGGTGGYESGGTGSGGSDAGGGYSAGGTGYAGTDAGGGYEAGGTGSGGFATAGTGAGGYASGGTGSQDQTCAQSVTHCFDAAANCYEYSPWSDCDQIVDVCAAMQATCGE